MYNVSVENNVVYFEFTGTQSFIEHKQAIEAFNNILDEHSNLIVIRIYHDTESLNVSKEVGKMTSAWMKHQGFAKIQNNVKAMLFIVNQEIFEKMKNQDVTRVFGIPGGIFSSLDSANEWFTNIFHHTIQDSNSY